MGIFLNSPCDYIWKDPSYNACQKNLPKNLSEPYPQQAVFRYHSRSTSTESPSKSITKTNPTTSKENCQPKRKIVFMKTHKTASRYALHFILHQNEHHLHDCCKHKMVTVWISFKFPPFLPNTLSSKIVKMVGLENTVHRIK